MKKRGLKIFAFLLAALLPAAAVFTMCFAGGGVYTDTYYAALGRQYDRLVSVRDPKVILIGNSSVAFGMDSELFGSLYGKPMVSFGLYGTLGTRLMLTLSKTGVRRGDIVVIAPEFNADAFSMNYNTQAIWKSVEGRADLLAHMEFELYDDLIGGSLTFASTRMEYLTAGERPVNDGAYRLENINEYGEIARGVRKGNILRSGYLDEPLLGGFDQIEPEFIDFVNKYIMECRLKGAQVYFACSPINGRAAERQGITEDVLLDIYGQLAERIDCRLISDPTQYVYDYRYFYDTNLHLNDSGTVLRTVRLVRDLLLAQGDNSHVGAELPPPPDPEVPTVEIDPSLNYTSSDLFEYREDNGYLTIVGTKEGAEQLEEIILPVLHEEKYITKVGAYALSECRQLQSLTLPVGISEISSFAFSGCTSLTQIHILETSGNNLSVYTDSFAGVNAACKLILHNATKAEFITGYFWPQIRLEIVEAV